MSGYDFGMLQPSSHQNKKSSPTFLVAIWSLFCLKKESAETEHNYVIMCGHFVSGTRS